MLFFRGRNRLVSDAATVLRLCPRCSNTVEFQLVWCKSGPTIGVPIVMLFTDRASVSLFKVYFLQCPICGYQERVDKNVAKGLIAEGRAQ
jgi:uncharacterized C2H2 Zn-finger protein